MQTIGAINQLIRKILNKTIQNIKLNLGSSFEK